MARVRTRMTPGWERRVETAAEERALEPISEAIARDANRLAPIGETHRLAGSYEVSGRGLTRRVGSPVEYAADVELGTSPHPITVKTKKVLADQAEGEIFGKRVMHPGTRPQPHLRPALYRRRSI